jgi:chromosome partitioning protein
MGYRVAVLDLDTPTLGLTRLAGLRSRQGLAAPLILPPPILPAGRTQTSKEAGAVIGAAVAESRARAVTLLLIDLEAVTSALWLKAAACLVADQVVTPIADSPLDLESILPEQGEGDLAQFIRSAGNNRPDWVVVRNRAAHLRTRLAEALGQRLQSGAESAGYRFVNGLSDRVAYREMFLHGRTPLDSPIGTHPLSISVIAARSELRRLAADLLDGRPRPETSDWRSTARL